MGLENLPEKQKPSPESKEKIKLSTRLYPLDEMGQEEIAFEVEKTESFKKLIEAARIEGDRNLRFWNLLVSTVERSGYAPPQDRETIILNLACGKCEEGFILDGFFGGGELGDRSKKVRIIGIDINPEAIDAARLENSYLDSKTAKWIQLPNYRFITGDAANLDQYKEIPKEADVIVVRHQNISSSSDTWAKIIEQALHRISEEGIVIITSNSDFEHEDLMDVLRNLNCEIVINEKNPFAKFFEKEAALDKNIVIIKRRNAK